ncbi:MDR family MFS transporter [Microbacterium sp. AGC85]
MTASQTDSIPTRDSVTDGDKMPRPVRIAISLLLAATFVVVLNETVMGVALPRLMMEFDITAATGQWLTTAFLLTLGIIIPTTGLILKRLTTRQVYFTALVLFSIGTALAAAAPVFSILLLARILQAAGTALMLPLLTATVLEFVPAHRRGRMMGMISVVIAVAPAVGPTVSGLVIDLLSWRWMFIIMLPIIAIAIVLGVVFMQNVGPTERVRFDIASIILAALGFGGLIFGLSSIGESSTGETIIHPAVSLATGVIALALFVSRQIVLQRSDRALMDLRPLASRTFWLPLILIVIAMGTLFGTLILLPLYLQNVIGLSALETGLILLPGAVIMGIVAPFIGRLFDRYGPRPLVIPGALVVSVALWAMTFLGESSTTAFIVAIHIALNVGLGCMMTPLMTTALGSVAPRLYSHGTAIVNTLQQVAGAAGTALFITLMSTTMAAEASAGAAPAAAELAGIHSAFVVGAFISLVMILLSFFIRRGAAAGRGVVALH